MIPNSDWVPISQASEYLSVSPATLRRMISRGEVDARRFGPRLIRVNLASIEKAATPLAYGGAS